MIKVNNEPSFFEKKKAQILEKTNRYFWIFLLFLVTEIAIAIFHFSKFIRGFIGDVLVIPLLFYFGKSIAKFTDKKILLLVLLIALCIEFLQLLNLPLLFNIESSIISVLLGNTFDLLDIMAYLFGGFMVLLLQRYLRVN